MEGLDPARDRQRLLGLYPTAFCPPQRFGFQAHMGDTVSASTRQTNTQKKTKKHRIHFFNSYEDHFSAVTLFLDILKVYSLSASCQVTQIASQPQVQAELTLRLTQLQTRLASLDRKSVV